MIFDSLPLFEYEGAIQAEIRREVVAVHQLDKNKESKIAHLDMDVNFEYQQGKRVISMIQGNMSLDNEDDDGCTMLVKGFHRHIYSWWERVIQRGISRHTKTGNTNVKDLYCLDDQIHYGIRANTMSTWSQGASTTAGDFPWFTGIQEDRETLDMAGAETWSQVSTYHRDLEVPKKQASGKAATSYGGQCNSLLPKITLPGACSISNALVGRIKWSDILVQRELLILFGEDEEQALRQEHHHI
ncbi:hypothetical protein BGX38DRAFT_1139770 [Terfezia claveryi]|nr:hypothetical protein BGX38DRAFT_1139770 [Terfezia claveryi]